VHSRPTPAPAQPATIQAPSPLPAPGPRSFDISGRQAHQIATAVSFVESYLDQGGAARCTGANVDQDGMPRRIQPARDYGLVYFSRAYGSGGVITLEWDSVDRAREGARIELSPDGSSVSRVDFWCTDEVVGEPATDFWIADPRWVRNIATAVAFVDAFNRGLESDALALIDDRIGGMTDCDYRAGVVRTYKGKQGITDWLRERQADHDQIAIGTLYNHGGSSNVIGASWAHRSSDTLRSIGFGGGIKPGTVAKLQYSVEGTRLMTVMFSPAPGQYQSDTICRPTA
jgi:hypothetical protein